MEALPDVPDDVARDAAVLARAGPRAATLRARDADGPRGQPAEREFFGDDAGRILAARNEFVVKRHKTEVCW